MFVPLDQNCHSCSTRLAVLWSSSVENTSWCHSCLLHNTSWKQEINCSQSANCVKMTWQMARQNTLVPLIRSCCPFLQCKKITNQIAFQKVHMVRWRPEAHGVWSGIIFLKIMPCDVYFSLHLDAEHNNPIICFFILMPYWLWPKITGRRFLYWSFHFEFKVDISWMNSTFCE